MVIGIGGLGHMATQILNACTPTTVIAVDRQPESLRIVDDAALTVLAGDETEAEIRELTHGRGADVVLDFVGSDDTLRLGAAVTRQLGHLTLVGIAGGTLPFNFFSPKYEVSVASTYWGSLPELMEVIALAETGKIRAHVQRFSLDEANQAYESMRAGTLHGRAVIVP